MKGEGSPLKRSSVPGGRPSDLSHEQRYAEGMGSSDRRERGYF
jgi:hypothetical protein